MARPAQEAAEQEAKEETQDPSTEMPAADPVLARQQQHQQNLQETNRRIMELRQQKTMIDDEIMALSNQTQQLIGALKEIAAQQA